MDGNVEGPHMPAREVYVGVVGDSAGWSRILDQERIAHRPDEDGSAPIVVTEGRLPSWASEFVAAGGTLVVSGALPEDQMLPAGVLASVTGFTPPGRERRVWAPGLVTLFDADGAGQLRLHEDRVVKYGVDPDVRPAVITARHGRGAVVASGIPLTHLLTAPGDRLRRFSRFSEVTERVAAVDKADVADTLLAMLERGFELARLPMASLPRFPEGARSALIFRVDVDGVFGDNLVRLAEGVTRHEIAASFYLNADLSNRYPGRMSGWDAGTEVGQHAFAHTLFDSVAENVDNLRAAESWMEASTGLVPSSFVGPRGLWNPQLGAALSALGYGYSSDFGLDFDSLPFRADAGVLQVPVHPYSPERATVWAAEQGLPAPTSQEVCAHYVDVVADHTRLGRLAHLYGHPEVLGSMVDDVLPALAAVAAKYALPRLTLGGYAEFWGTRERATPLVLIDDVNGVEISVEDVGLRISVRATSPLPVVVNGRRVEDATPYRLQPQG